jgi:hypothetical protein
MHRFPAALRRPYTGRARLNTVPPPRIVIAIAAGNDYF